MVDRRHIENRFFLLNSEYREIWYEEAKSGSNTGHVTKIPHFETS